MGDTRHNAIIVTTREPDMVRFMAAATLLGATTLAGPTQSPLNGHWTVLVVPDGSKLGWPERDEGNALRADIIEWLDANQYEDGSGPYDWVHVEYGGDARVAVVLDSAYHSECLDEDDVPY